MSARESVRQTMAEAQVAMRSQGALTLRCRPMTDRAFERLVAALPRRAAAPLLSHARLLARRRRHGPGDVRSSVASDGFTGTTRVLVLLWLYRIGTNVCIDELARRPTRVLPAGAGPAGDPDAPPCPHPRSRRGWSLVPARGRRNGPRDPAAKVELKESVALAFIAAPAAHDALHRGPCSFCATSWGSPRRRPPGRSRCPCPRRRARSTAHARPFKSVRSPPEEAIDTKLLARYVRAWETAGP